MRSSDTSPNRSTAVTAIKTVTGLRIAMRVICTGSTRGAACRRWPLPAYRSTTLVLSPSFRRPWPATTTVWPSSTPDRTCTSVSL